MPALRHTFVRRLKTMTSISEATEPSPKNNARVREAFEQLPDAELAACASAQPDTAKGYVANQILAERRVARAEQAASLATERHAALVRAIATPHWSQTPGFWVAVIAAVAAVVAAWPVVMTQALQSSPTEFKPVVTAPQAQSVSAVPLQIPASSPASQLQGPRK